MQPGALLDHIEVHVYVSVHWQVGNLPPLEDMRESRCAVLLQDIVLLGKGRFCFHESS